MADLNGTVFALLASTGLSVEQPAQINERVIVHGCGTLEGRRSFEEVVVACQMYPIWIFRMSLTGG